ncbi:MAG: putative ABC transport system ATP-binding protein, partial [Limisphaerales bacterium]
MKATIKDAEFGYAEGGFRLRIPELEIASGEKVAFVGASGSGKTTLLRLLAGVNAPEKGTIDADGLRLGELSDAERRSFRIRKVGFV